MVSAVPSAERAPGPRRGAEPGQLLRYGAVQRAVPQKEGKHPLCRRYCSSARSFLDTLPAAREPPGWLLSAVAAPRHPSRAVTRLGLERSACFLTPVCSCLLL